MTACVDEGRQRIRPIAPGSAWALPALNDLREGASVMAKVDLPPKLVASQPLAQLRAPAPAAKTAEPVASAKVDRRTAQMIDLKAGLLQSNDLSLMLNGLKTLRDATSKPASEPGAVSLTQLGLTPEGFKSFEAEVMQRARTFVRQDLNASEVAPIAYAMNKATTIRNAASSSGVPLTELGTSLKELQEKATAPLKQQVEFLKAASHLGGTGDLKESLAAFKGAIADGLTSWAALGTSEAELSSLNQAAPPELDTTGRQRAALALLNPFPYGMIGQEQFDAVKADVPKLAKALGISEQRLTARIADVIRGSQAAGSYPLK